jgi:citrate synthase
VSSTGTDTYSAIAAAVGSLKGPLHGGANAKVMEMFNDAKATILNPHDDGQVRDYIDKVLRKETNDNSGLVYGMGHAVYTISDPRAVLLKKYARELAEKTGMYEDLLLMEKIEKHAVELIPNFRRRDVPVCANVDMYSGLVYEMLKIPSDLFTPLFAVARISGWCAHRIEETYCKRIMRPAYKSAFELTQYVDMEAR